MFSTQIIRPNFTGTIVSKLKAVYLGDKKNTKLPILPYQLAGLKRMTGLPSIRQGTKMNMSIISKYIGKEKFAELFPGMKLIDEGNEEIEDSSSDSSDNIEVVDPEEVKKKELEKKLMQIPARVHFHLNRSIGAHAKSVSPPKSEKREKFTLEIIGEKDDKNTKKLKEDLAVHVKEYNRKKMKKEEMLKKEKEEEIKKIDYYEQIKEKEMLVQENIQNSRKEMMDKLKKKRGFENKITQKNKELQNIF